MGLKMHRMKKTFHVLFCLSMLGISSYGQQTADPKDTEVWEPVPPVVTPGENNLPPSDAIVLFDGTTLDEWVSLKGEKAAWEVKDGVLTVVPKAGMISTRKSFGNCQLHIEWRTPAVVKGEGQGRGNSGVFLMGKYEVQVLDSYENSTYPNGQAASVYKQLIPLVNACKPPGEWQSYDVIFTAPVFDEKGMLLKPAWITLLHNGILVQNNTEIQGPTEYIGKPVYKAHPDKMPLSLQDHGNPVSFRNIWIREL
jgi:hypothetical protein